MGCNSTGKCRFLLIVTPAVSVGLAFLRSSYVDVDLIHYVETCGSTQLRRSRAPAAELATDCRVTWPVWMSIGACHDCLGRTVDSRVKPSLERSWVFPLSDCAVRGVPLKCPARSTDYLAHFYGPSWTTAHSPPRRATGLYFDLLDMMLGQAPNKRRL